MAHPLHHAESSARKFGGIPDDYQHVHDWFDSSKEHLGLFIHRPHVILTLWNRLISVRGAGYAEPWD